MAIMNLIMAILSSVSSPLEGEEAKAWTCESKSKLLLPAVGLDLHRAPPGGRSLLAVLIICLCLTATGSAEAGQAEVRDVALSNNCPPKKIEIFRQSLGADGTTIYQVQCVLPKIVGTTDSAAKPPDGILVSCKQNMCDMLRPVTLEKK
jgi:hypothetical protein